jgi:hypothetical protein
MKRRLIDRIQDRAWREFSNRQAVAYQPPPDIPADGSSSISAGMPWVSACAALAGGHITSRGFRRLSAVRDIVETVGTSEGRFYAAKIRGWDASWLDHPRVLAADAWGDPVRWPGILLGTPHAFSPTTLRYLATALWLRKSGYLEKDSAVVEIGVGFGGLAAMNALVSGAVTTLVDLPEVARAAGHMLGEIDLAKHCRIGDEEPRDIPLVISNYAFTELNSDVQQRYFDRYLKQARHGVIISNSAVFAGSIRGRNDDELLAWLREGGLPATLDKTHEMLGPGDYLCGVTLIHW